MDKDRLKSICRSFDSLRSLRMTSYYLAFRMTSNYLALRMTIYYLGLTMKTYYLALRIKFMGIRA